MRLRSHVQTIATLTHSLPLHQHSQNTSPASITDAMQNYRRRPPDYVLWPQKNSFQSAAINNVAPDTECDGPVPAASHPSLVDSTHDLALASASENLAGLSAAPVAFRHHMDSRYRSLNVRQPARFMCRSQRLQGFCPVPVGLHHRMVSELDSRCWGKKTGHSTL